MFGKRVDTGKCEDRNAHFANQDTAFLLQRIENYNGLVIVASNLKQNMDDAFMRRFQMVITFEVQDEARRLELWRRHLPQACTLDPNVNLPLLAQRHQFTAASIVAICNRVALLTLQKGSNSIALADMEQAIREEIYK